MLSMDRDFPAIRKIGTLELNCTSQTILCVFELVVLFLLLLLLLLGGEDGHYLEDDS